MLSETRTAANTDHPNPLLGSDVLAYDYPPLATLADVVSIEQVPLEQRISRWDFALNLLDGCRRHPEKPALHATNRGDLDADIITWTFAELEQHSIRVANLLHAQGVGKDDCIAIISPTVPAIFAALLGGFLAGRPFAINWMLDANAISDLLESAGAKVVIALGPTPDFPVFETVSAALQKLPTRPDLFTVHDPFAPPHERDLLTAASRHASDQLEFERRTAQRHEVACYVHSGGTTGHPKIVRILHQGLVFRQWATNLGLAFDPDDVVLSDTPLFHIGGLLVRGLVSTANSHTAVLPSMHGARDKLYLKNYWRYVERFGITQISGVPTTLSVLAKNPPTHERISSLRPYFATGSAAIPPAVQQRILEITGARTLQSYGMTENTSHATLDPRDGQIRPGCSGIRLPYVKLRVVKTGPNGEIIRDCAPNEPGMILVGGPGVAGGYLNAEQNEGTFLPDGYFVTGDLGCLDDDGYIRIIGREKDLIIRGGHNIEPGLIEQALHTSPWVAIAAAVGKPDAHAGELPIAYVELHPNAHVSEDELLRYIADKIPERPAVPKEIIFLEKLPLSSIGKPLKHVLRLDAAKRAFQTALQSVPGSWDLDVTHSDDQGLTVTVVLHHPSPEARTLAENILSAYAIPYMIKEQM